MMTMKTAFFVAGVAAFAVASVACGDPPEDETATTDTTSKAQAVAVDDGSEEPGADGPCDRPRPPPPPPGGGPRCDSGSACPAATVCCAAPEPCAGACVPDCRLAPGGDRCPSGSSCDSDGVCKRPDGLPPGPPPPPK